MSLTNWNGMKKGSGRDWYLANSLIALGNEINGHWPRRDVSSDGAIGDSSHQARKSDHNPDWNANGVVRAIDIDVNGIDANAVVKALIGDQRVWYVIYDHYIYSRTYNWAKRRYTGDDDHTGHVHVSIQHTKAAENDTSRWLSTNTPNPLQDWEAIMALFNTKEEFEASVAAGVETGVGKYMSRFLSDEQGSGDTILDDTKDFRTAMLAAMRDNTAALQKVLATKS